MLSRHTFHKLFFSALLFFSAPLWAQEKVLVVGDSLAWGLGSKDPAFRPAACLQKHFSSFGKAVSVKNMSFPGFSSHDVEVGLPKIIAESPTVVFISAGGNDAMIDVAGDFTPEKTLTVMAHVFDELLKTGAQVIYLGLNPPYVHAERLPLVTALAKSKNILVVDGMKNFWLDPQWMYDEFHPNEKGYQVLCGRIVLELTLHQPSTLGSILPLHSR